jgi:hypothetical protein
MLPGMKRARKAADEILPVPMLDEPAAVIRKGTALPHGAPRTLIVVGPARSGTTMVAKMLHDLGIFMGERLGGTCQDALMSEISRALFHGRVEISHPRIEEVLRSRDRLFPVWGWKFTDHLFEPLYAKTRNPHLILVFRDPVAIATRESVSQGRAVLSGFRRAIQQLADFGQLLASTPYPCLAISYERGLQRKPELVDALLDFAGTKASSQARERAMASAQPGSLEYLRESKAPDIEGIIDEVGAHIEGWLRCPHLPHKRVAFTLLIDGNPLCRGVADRYRADLEQEFNNDGCCSFAIPVPERLRDGRRHRVKIEVSGSADHAIGNNGAEWVIERR